MTFLPINGAEFGVVIPAYNAIRTLQRTVTSAQRAGATTVLVVDDGSTDRTAALAAELGCMVISQSNSGAAAARRVGIQTLTEPFLVLLDSDDELVDIGVRESVRRLLEDDTAVAAQGKTIGIGHGGIEVELRPWVSGVSIDSLLTRGHAPGPPAAFVWRASALKLVVSDSPPAVWPRYAEDFEFVIRGALLGPVLVHGAISCRYQWTGGKSSASPLNSIRDAERIRLHYAEQVGMQLSSRTPAQIRSMVFMRRASSYTSGAQRLRWFGYVLLATTADPVGVGTRALKRMRARING